MIEDEFFSDEESFQEWLFFASDVLEIFSEDFKELQLDYSPESLIRLEKWILDNHATTQSFLDNEPAKVLDEMIRYVGRVYVKNLNGKWDVSLDDPQYVYYSFPIVKIGKGIEASPLTDILSCTDRRYGDYMYKMFKNTEEEMEEKGVR
ncbi:hypothetical protein [Shimazuella kribbensis]|uniref:hypothetical protein n=1 Tax=Shimazuella kribbensis TaxID=139808 RepID=UPI000416A03E|nr:hypothetical protein [Shimazuella kribbensis]